MNNSNKSIVTRRPVAEIVQEPRYPIPEAAALLGKSTCTLRRWMREHKIGFYQVGKNVFIGEREIARILEEGFVPARDAA